MKRLFLILLTIILVSALILTGCAKQAPAPAPAPTPAPGPAPAPAPVKPKQLKLSTAFPPVSPFMEEIGRWVKAIEEGTGGKVKIVTYPSASLVKVPDQYDALTSGLCDLALVLSEMTPGRFPRSEISTLPMVFPSGEVIGRVYHELLNKYCVDTELSEVKLLWIMPLPPGQLIMTKPVQKLEDMKGLKIRIEGKLEGQTMETLGATGVLIDTMEIYTSIERGLIDGICFVWNGIFVYGIQEVTQYRTECNLLCRGFPLMINKDIWNSFSPDIQKVFEENSGIDYSVKAGKFMDGLQVDARRDLVEYDKKAGNPPIYVLPEDEKARWREKVSSIWDAWVKEKESQGLPGRAILDDALSLVKKYSE